jgi:D-alanine-D-alanine ligase
MRVAFLYNCSSEDPAHTVEDEEPTRSPVVAALKRLGHSVVPVACTLNLATTRETLLRVKPDVVFNRVESLGGSDSMMAAPTLLLDSLQLPYTGNSTAALVATASKIAVKERLRMAGLPTPSWIDLKNGEHDAQAPLTSGRSKLILKAIYEHASFAMTDGSVVRPSCVAEVDELLRNLAARTGRPHFAEQFIEGREFNVSLFGDEPRVLPPAEIDFSEYPSDCERIVGYNAKCNTASVEYDRTERRFEFGGSDRSLLQRLHNLSVQCWRLFGLCGYARVDFRVDMLGDPWILEINSNPCILPDSGFAAALEYAGISYVEAIQWILDNAITRFASAARKLIAIGGQTLDEAGRHFAV